jgi:hypothetical protein
MKTAPQKSKALTTKQMPMPMENNANTDKAA